MDTPKMITIQEARRSQSGKTLGIRDQDGTWYQTKLWDLEMMTGATVYAMTSISEWQGKQMHWLNSYEMPEGQVGVSVPAPPQGQQPQSVNPAPAPMAPLQPIQTPVQHPQASATAQPQQVDRDASIVAQTLCKTVTFSNIDAAWSAYLTIYASYMDWRDKGLSPQAEANETVQQQGVSDEIPF
jgi:hypothetical protein